MGDIFFYKDEAHKIVLIFQIEKKDDLKCFIVCAKCKSRTFVLRAFKFKCVISLFAENIFNMRS